MIKRISKIGVLLIAFLMVAGGSAYLTVTLIIRSEDAVVVPDLNGKDVVYVLKILTDLGLNTKVKGSEYDDAVPMNHVIYQEPEPGSEIKRGRDIRIVISKGSFRVLTPNLVGLPLQQARIILDENGLSLGKASASYSDSVKKEEVMAQVPLPGAMIKRSTSVDLLTSMGVRPGAYKMPALTGRPLEEAILIIESSNLLLGNIKSVSMGSKPANAIVSQEPTAGERVFEGGSVNLEVNTRDDKMRGAVIEDAGGVRLYRYRQESGFIKERIGIKMEWFGFSTDLYDEFMGSGQEIWILIPKNQDVSVSLYKNGEFAEKQFFSAWQSLAN
ncbi:MAG: PASTA domain-containing protein [Desulfobacterales bacterium]|nr:PASTA domain-containing protein [Desulfobacterales bacterium]